MYLTKAGDDPLDLQYIQPLTGIQLAPMLYVRNDGTSFKLRIQTPIIGTPARSEINPEDPGSEYFEWFWKSLMDVCSSEQEALEDAAAAQDLESTTAMQSESQIRSIVHQYLTEDLDRSDRSEIKRMISKEIEGVTNRRQIEKTFQTQFDKELRKALGVSFFGTPGKINKFVVDAINDEVARILGDKATRQMMADITKEVLVRLYKELSFHQEPVIRRIKI